ncbi:MAG: Gfo/Idh/MocA family oxidoreductase [Verrucomicrobiota bacterium]
MNTKQGLPRYQTADLSRRQFLKESSLAASGAVAAASFPFVLTGHAAETQPIRVGLIGCGGRGTGAVANVLEAADNVKIVAMADLFKDRLESSRNELKAIRVEVPDNRCFIGFDAYQHLVALPEVNYVILATMPHFRPLHLRAAIDAGKHVFMEKPVAVDGPGIRSIIESGELAKDKGLSIVAGTQRRHQTDYRETIRRLRDGAIGSVLVGRAYWNDTELWHHGRKPEWSEMEYQCRNWYYFIWLSGDHIVEQHVHNLDVMNWVMGAHPIKASGNGGRQARTDPKYGSIFDHFAVEYEYANGARVYSYSRQTNATERNVSEAVIGAIGTSNCQNLIQAKGEKPWRFAEKSPNGYVQEHADLIASIRAGKPLNEARQIAESTLTAIMGREAAYSGQSITWEQMLNSNVSRAPDKYDFETPPPPEEVPIPGKYKMA